MHPQRKMYLCFSHLKNMLCDLGKREEKNSNLGVLVIFFKILFLHLTSFPTILLLVVKIKMNEIKGEKRQMNGG